MRRTGAPKRSIPGPCECEQQHFNNNTNLLRVLTELIKINVCVSGWIWMINVQ